MVAQRVKSEVLQVNDQFKLFDRFKVVSLAISLTITEFFSYFMHLKTKMPNINFIP